MFSWIKGACLSLVLGGMSLSLCAHPHAWIDVQTYVAGSGTEAYGINMVWRFDPMTSAYLMEGKPLKGEQQGQALDQIAAGLIESLKRDSFFTQVRWKQQLLNNLEASLARATLDGLDVILSFYLEFDDPLSLSGHALAIQVFDPSYFIEMTWPNDTDLQLSDALNHHCKGQVSESDPSPEQISKAWAMPADASPDLTLGAAFAQQGRIICQ